MRIGKNIILYYHYLKLRIQYNLKRLINIHFLILKIIQKSKALILIGKLKNLNCNYLNSKFCNSLDP